MRHSVYGKKLGRDKNQRTALFKNLVRELLLHGSIQTTQAKAKAVKGLIDRIISKAKQDSASSGRFLQSTLTQKNIIDKLVKEIAPRYNLRTSGFTSIVKMGTRAGDGAMMVRMSLVDGSRVEEPKPKGIKSGKDEKPANKEKKGDKKSRVRAQMSNT